MLDRPSLEETPYWKAYRDSFRKLIESDESGMVLRANEMNSQEDGENNAKVAFKLQSGRVVREFITIWELFDLSDQFNECLDKLAEKAREIRRRRHFSKIVTATSTAKELGVYVFERLKEEPQSQDLSAYHFGGYLSTPMAENGDSEFRDQKVLVLTDVVSTGSLIRNMAEIITKKGGSVVAVLSVILTDPELISLQKTSKEPPRLLPGKKRSPRIHSLTDYSVTPLEAHEYDEESLITIDYNSILPETRKNTSQSYKLAFAPDQLFRHLEESKAIDFGFFEFDDRRYTCAFLLNRLLNVMGKPIWENIRSPIMQTAEINGQGAVDEGASPLILVTTHKQQDLQFKYFVEKKLKEEGIDTQAVITLKRGVKDLPYLNLTLGVRGEKVEGKAVVLVLGALSTTVKLHSLVSLLVSKDVKRITVVCLLNEMGPYSTQFVRDIRHFANRALVESGQSSATTLFEFHVVYGFLDIAEDDISRMHKEVEWLFSPFKQKTKVPAFARISDRMKGYFRPSSFSRRQFEEAESKNTNYSLPPREGFSVPHSKVDLSSVAVSSVEGRMALMTYNLALHRDFNPIIQELSEFLDRRRAIYLYGLILSDIHYLQFIKNCHY